EEEFFATRNRHIAEAKNKAERCRRIEWLAEGQLTNRLVLETAGNGRSGRRSDRRSDFSPTNKPLEGGKSDLSPTYNPTHKFDGHGAAERRLYRDFIAARRTAEAASLFAHVKAKEGGRYPLTGVGDVNTYALFAETISQLIGPNGRAGFIVPTGIATDDSTKAYFGHIVQRRQLVSLFDIENREKVFPAVDSRMKFCLLTLGVSEQAEFAFFLTNTGQLADDRRRFALTASDFSRINPNTLTCPVFRSRMDAELTRKIYRRVPVLIREGQANEPEQNP
ncbi:MAG: SAM-dependent DNA methyltransferase, partial [Methylococcales bacterium]